MHIQAAVLRETHATGPYSQSRPLGVETLDLEAPGFGEVLVEIKAAGLCHSDLSVMDGSRPRPLPMALGHESVGVVRAVGRGVSTLAVNDHVVSTFVPSCGQCLPCQEGRPALCHMAAKSNGEGVLLSGSRRLRKGHEYIHHHLGVSAFATYAVMDQHSLIKIPYDLPFEKAALFGCAVLTGVGAVINTARIEVGARVAIVGLGGVGFSALLGAIVAGAAMIMAIDINPDKLKRAQTLGATHVINATEVDASKMARDVSNGGVDYAIEAAGSVEAMALAYQITCRGGTTVTAGLPHPSKHFAFPLVTMVAEERTVKGSYMGSSVPRRDIPRYVDLYRQGRLPIDQLLTDRIALKDINQGFDRLANGLSIRTVILF